MLENGRVTENKNVIYFGNLRSRCGSIEHTGDNLTGEGSGDDEQIIVDLQKVPSHIHKLVFVVNIYDCVKRSQHFGMIENAFIRIVNMNDRSEMVKYNLRDDYSGRTSLIAGEIYRDVPSGNSPLSEKAQTIRALRKSLNATPDIHIRNGEINMAISLAKGQKIDLTKTNPGLSKVVVGLGWDVNQYDGGADFDLDASVFLLNAEGKCSSEKDFIFYNQTEGAGGAVIHTGDNRTGEGEGDDEQVKINLNAVPADIQKISFVITIHEAEARRQNFGQVSNAYVRVINEDSNEELIRYDLGEDFSIETALITGEAVPPRRGMEVLSDRLRLSRRAGEDRHRFRPAGRLILKIRTAGAGWRPLVRLTFL